MLYQMRSGEEEGGVGPMAMLHVLRVLEVYYIFTEKMEECSAQQMLSKPAMARY